MVRMGQSTLRTAIGYQHSADNRQRELAVKLDHRILTDLSHRSAVDSRTAP
ncbi:hypothetical protein K353_06207 [Kitasatospora sp. SolWspMP-SS2h]|nr:hypothetical protein K353_06207 [Kitasatospora sp. SolWspMP-SS2h]